MSPLLCLVGALSVGWAQDQDQGDGPEAPPDAGQGQTPVAQSPSKWETRTYLRPRGGLSMVSTGNGTSSALSLGAQAGLRYWETGRDLPRLMGNARVQGDYLVGSNDVSGMEIRVGNFIGPRWKFVGIQTGPDVFWSQYTYGSLSLDPTLGLGWPVLAFADLDVLSLYGGVEPAFYFNPDRARVDWSTEDAFGFGHEFSYMAGASLNGGGVRLNFGWVYRITAIGAQQGLSLGVRVGA